MIDAVSQCTQRSIAYFIGGGNVRKPCWKREHQSLKSLKQETGAPKGARIGSAAGDVLNMKEVIKASGIAYFTFTCDAH